uniref:non-specific serine/threonine protein kinase n=1 Tax=Sedum alfredii TaxID=439688 RepID=A0A410N6A7_9MAGN|nr:LRR receptor-like serine/threonine-protein kinase RPK2 [Sedum alfredii]
MKRGCGFCRGTLVWIHVVVLVLCFCDSIWSREGGDRDVLLELKRLVSDPTGVLSSWDDESQLSHCEWYGVSCDDESRVSEIQLVGGCSDGGVQFHGFGITAWNCSIGRLEGKLTSRVGELKNLRVLSLAFNHFSGKIPTEIWGMDSLEVLDLEGNLFTEDIPRKFSGMRKLRVLNLRFNRLLGRVPLVTNLRLLKVLDLAGNKMDGIVPEFVDRYGNGCQYLEYIDLSRNGLSGVIPRSLGKCRCVKMVLLFLNSFTGSIPKEFGLLGNLEVLDVSRNSLSGLIPVELGNCAVLSVLILSDYYEPYMSWKSALGEVKLSAYADDHNSFESLPSEVAALSKLKIFWAPRAKLSGKLPQIWGSNLEMLNLAENQIFGEVTGAFTNCENLHHLNLSKNKLVGRLDEKLRVPCMSLFDISCNLMTGYIPNFRNNNCTCPSPMIVLKRNQWTNLPSEYLSAMDSESVIIHDFSDNRFTGPIPQLPLPCKVSAKHVSYAFLAAKNSLVGELPSYLTDASGYLNSLMIDLSDNMLSGEIPPSIDTAYKSLKSLNVSNNRISGSIPQSLGDVDTIELLDLSGNKLQGRIPDTIGRLKNIRFLSLSRNNLSGAIPSTFSQLLSLTTLKLSSNSLSGKIPQGFGLLSNLTTLELDNNRLSSDIFSNLFGSTLVKNNDSQIAFSRRAILLSSGDTDSLNYTTESDAGEVASGNGSLNSIEIASIVSASAIVSVLLALVILFIYTRKWAPDSRVQVSVPKEITLFTDIGTPLTFDKISNSTANFNASNCIGNGGFGATYRAEIAPGVVVAVKRLSVGRFHGVQQFHAEIKTLERVRHPNLVTLIGYHASETEMFLIYNYLPGGNLANFIQERNEKATDWRIIHKIALDIAQALAYLHDQCVPRVLHRDVKPSNILLDNELNAYLSDFGLSRLLGTSETHATTGVAGTFGYLAPEYAMTCRVSDKADVYSYGIVLLELLSDKKTLDPSFSAHENGFTIVSWASMLLREGRAKDVFNPRLWETGPHKKLVDTLHLAVRCTVETLSIRPTMRQVAQQLKQLQPRNQGN